LAAVVSGYSNSETGVTRHRDFRLAPKSFHVSTQSGKSLAVRGTKVYTTGPINAAMLDSSTANRSGPNALRDPLQMVYETGAVLETGAWFIPSCLR
jgi:hypothetical protein